MILSKLLSSKTVGYEKLSCDAQQRILGTLEFMTGVDLMQQHHKVDGLERLFSLPHLKLGEGFCFVCWWF